MILDIKPFEGQHCETTATGTLLKQIGIELSEPMLFGLGEGLSFIFWNMKTMSHPFIGGRVKPDLLTENIARNLSLELKATESSSSIKAWHGIKEFVDSNKIVGLKLDCYYLDYFSKPFHFAGHYVAFYGYDSEFAYLVDTKQQGTRVQTTLTSLARARSEKGPMASRNLFYTVANKSKLPNLSKAIRAAIKNNSREYLRPPISNISYKGIQKTSNELVKWFDRSKDIKGEFSQMAMLMEKAGTGGSLFRNLYRDFLIESSQILNEPEVKKAAASFREIAILWKEIADLFEKIGRTGDKQHLNQAQQILKEIAMREESSMRLLYSI